MARILKKVVALKPSRRGGLEFEVLRAVRGLGDFQKVKKERPFGAFLELLVWCEEGEDPPYTDPGKPWGGPPPHGC